MEEVFIVAAKRTPVGAFMGALSDHSAPQMGALVIRDILHHVGLDAIHIEAAYIGNVLSANIGQSPARQAALLAGLPAEADCTGINKVCASGLKAVMLAAQQIQLGINDLVIAGGMESMSNTPHYEYRRKITKPGNAELTDGILKDGLTDAFEHWHMGVGAESCAALYEISRTEQDEYALQSYERAHNATVRGKFKGEITPVLIKGKKEDDLFSIDEDISKLIPGKIATLKPAFKVNGTVTAANASNLNDGAAMLLLAPGAAVAKHNLKPIAKILSYADAALAPDKFTVAPAVAIEKMLRSAGLSLKEIDYLEINEAYAAVAIANNRILELDSNKVNVYGGAVAIGHPLGASGARILTTLTSVLQNENGKYGIAAICNGGGGASAILIEKI